jgi:hypothetical protein
MPWWHEVYGLAARNDSLIIAMGPSSSDNVQGNCVNNAWRMGAYPREFQTKHRRTSVFVFCAGLPAGVPTVAQRCLLRQVYPRLVRHHQYSISACSTYFLTLRNLPSKVEIVVLQS